MRPMDYARLVQEAIDEHRVSPVDLLGIGDAAGEYAYLDVSRPSYVRTVQDVDGLFPAGRVGRNILEIGSFLGPVSVVLRKLGYGVSALDIPEFHASERLRALYARHAIPFAGLNLRQAALPYDAGSFDAVIFCEVMEHWNFNPLPVLQEVNRVLKTGGYVYIGMPNQAGIVNRLKLMFGRSIHNPVGDFFKQLDRGSNMIVGLHWREYTQQEAVDLIEGMGFETAAKYFFVEEVRADAGLLRRLARAAVFSYPPFRPSQVVIGRKLAASAREFWRTEANA
jgi:SAM-dependent methyltransferase